MHRSIHFYVSTSISQCVTLLNVTLYCEIESRNTTTSIVYNNSMEKTKFKTEKKYTRTKLKINGTSKSWLSRSSESKRRQYYVHIVTYILRVGYMQSLSSCHYSRTMMLLSVSIIQTHTQNTHKTIHCVYKSLLSVFIRGIGFWVRSLFYCSIKNTWHFCIYLTAFSWRFQSQFQYQNRM